MQNIEIWQADSSTGNTTMAVKNSVPITNHSFPVPTHLISICWWFSAWKMLNKATNLSLHIYMLAGSCIWSAVSKYQNGTPKVVRKAFNIGRSGTQYVAIVTKLLSSYWRAHLVEYYRKESNISDTFHHIWTKFDCVWRHHLANLHI